MDSSTENAVFSINIFFRPGHYDKCYSVEDLEIKENSE